MCSANAELIITFSVSHFHSFHSFTYWWANLALHDCSNHLKKEKTERWPLLQGHTCIQMSNALLMPTRCMCFSTAWFHCTTAFLWLVVLPAAWSNQSTPRRDNSFTFAEASFVTIPVVWLTLHDQKSGCLMFYQRQLGGCLCMCLPNCVCVCVQVKCSLFVSECLYVKEENRGCCDNLLY